MLPPHLTSLPHPDVEALGPALHVQDAEMDTRVVGVLGGGQLGRMMAEAAGPLGEFPGQAKTAGTQQPTRLHTLLRTCLRRCCPCAPSTHHHARSCPPLSPISTALTRRPLPPASPTSPGVKLCILDPKGTESPAGLLLPEAQCIKVRGTGKHTDREKWRWVDGVCERGRAHLPCGADQSSPVSRTTADRARSRRRRLSASWQRPATL